MAFEYRSDESLIRLYESLRSHVVTDREINRKFVAGKAAQDHAAALFAEISKRGLNVQPIRFE